jgi:mannose-6-phosphate isomerase-like protein (cupin superfamily)
MVNRVDHRAEACHGQVVNHIDHLETPVPIITAPAGPTHDLGGTRFTSLATPLRGATRTSVWQVEIDPGTPATPHSLTSEEVFVVLAGTAAVRLGDEHSRATTGDAIVVPAGVPFELTNEGDGPLRLLCCMPVGGQARLDDGTTFTPPWAQ